MGRRAVARLISSIASRAKSSSSPSLPPSSTQIRHLTSAPPSPAVFVDKTTRVICQGITGKNGTFHTEQAIEYGTKMQAAEFSETFDYIYAYGGLVETTRILLLNHWIFLYAEGHFLPTDKNNPFSFLDASILEEQYTDTGHMDDFF